MINNFVFGLITAVIVLTLFSIIEKRRVPSIGMIKYVWLLLVLIAAQMVDVENNLIEWSIWVLFLYTTLDDLRTKTVFVPLYFLIIGITFFNGGTGKEFVFAIIVFVVFLVISNKTKETFFKLGDVYAIFALSFFLGSEILLSLIFSVFLAGAILPGIRFVYKAKYYAFLPFLVMGAIITKENWYMLEVLFFSFIINICWIILSLFLKENRKRG